MAKAGYSKTTKRRTCRFCVVCNKEVFKIHKGICRDCLKKKNPTEFLFNEWHRKFEESGNTFPFKEGVK